MVIIVKQPNGQHALYDLANRIFVHKDSTIADIRNSLIALEINKIDSDIVDFYKNRISKCGTVVDPYYDIVTKLE